jgi:2'-5' RNA ligase
MFKTVRFYHLIHMQIPQTETLENCYVSLDIEDAPQLQKISESISNLLTRLEVPHEKSPRPHVSIAYTEGLTSRANLDEILSSIAEKPFYFKPNGICIMEGLTTDKNYICLKLENSEEFVTASKYINANFKVKVFKDGFAAHLSLFRIPKMEMSEDHYHLIAKYLESALSALEISTKINTNSVSVFSSCKKSVNYPVRKKA